MGPLQERLQPRAPCPYPCEGRGGRRKLPRENAAALRRPRILTMDSPRYCNSDRSIQAYFSCVCRRWVSRSTEGSSLASSAVLSTLRAVRQTASLPTKIGRAHV